MKLWEISKLMNTDRLFKVSDNESVDTETGEVFAKEYLDNLPMEQEEKSRNVGLVIKNMSNDMEQIEKEIKRLTAMKKSTQSKIESLKSYILTYGCPVKDVAVTIRFSKGRESVEVEKGVDLPEPFRNYTWTPNKKAIGEALKEGQEIEGCRLVRKPSVSVK
nr:MAG TPA: resistance protein [Caudoviricetes sp.]